ncbi:MAG: hypothetical protein WC385_02050 [Candidatus Paceibacterota bacterium]|jgi:hypothetical protein
MAKKIIITILIILILGSAGVIGYIILSQNGGINLSWLWPFGQNSNSAQVPKVPANFFPVSTTTRPNLVITNSNGSNLAPNLATNSQGNQPAIDSPALAGTSALGLTVDTSNKSERVLFIDRSSGNFYEITPQNDLSRLTNETLNDIRELHWGRDKTGRRVIMRFAQSGQLITLSSLFKNTASTSFETLTSKIISTTLSAIAVSPDGTRLFILEPTTTGATGYLSDWDGKNKKKIVSLPYADWQIAWPSPNIISLVTTPSALDLGYLYFLNPNTGSLTKTLKGINGLTANVSPDGQKMIFSRNLLGQFGLYSYDLTTKKTGTLGLNTLPEKCLWADNVSLYCAIPRSIPSGRYPDDWYQGKIAFADDIWKIDLKQQKTVLAISPKDPYDLVNLVVAPKRGWLYAINKPDNSIQSFRLPSE